MSFFLAFFFRSFRSLRRFSFFLSLRLLLEEDELLLLLLSLLSPPLSEDEASEAELAILSIPILDLFVAAFRSVSWMAG